MIGHGLGAAGAIEFITCVKSIEEDYIHPTVGLKVPDEECDLDYTLEPVTRPQGKLTLLSQFYLDLEDITQHFL